MSGKYHILGRKRAVLLCGILGVCGVVAAAVSGVTLLGARAQEEGILTNTVSGAPESLRVAQRLPTAPMDAVIAANALVDAPVPAARVPLASLSALASVARNEIVTTREAEPVQANSVDIAMQQLLAQQNALALAQSAATRGSSAVPGDQALAASSQPPASESPMTTAAYVPPASSEVVFDASMLRGAVDVDLSRFSQSYGVLPGAYQVDLYVNDNWRGRRDVYFAPTRAGELQTWPCYDRALLDTLGFRWEDLRPQQQAALANGNELCAPLETFYPAAHAEYDSGLRRLDVTAPQSLLRRAAMRDEVDPAQWEDGVTAGLLQYRYNGLTRQAGGAQETSHYLSLTGGLNWGAWRLRHNGAFTHDATEGLGYASGSLYVERPLRDLKSHLTFGQTTTDGWVFDSMRFTGVRLGSDRRMRPDWEQQFAPVVHGTARTNARVRVEQLGYVVYETTVPPGPFALDDLPATGARGEMLVTVTEADGTEHSFTVYQTGMQEMLRPGQTDYALSFGRFRSDGLLARDPWMIQGNIRHGLSNSMTAYAGFLGAEGYSALALGAAFNLPIGSVASDVTLAQAGTLLGYSARAVYTHNLPAAGTYLNLSAYRNSATYFDSVQGFNIRNGMASDAVLQRRNQFLLGVNQRLPHEWGTISASISHRDFWTLPMREVEYQMDYSVVLQKKLTVGLSVSRNLNTLANRWNTQAMLTFSMPLGGVNNPTYLQTRYTHTDTAQSLMTGMSSAFGANNQAAYQIFATADKPKTGSVQPTGLANLSWRTSRATVSANAYAGRNSRQLGLGLSGSLVAFHGGLVLGGDTVGETTAIVRAPGAAGARIENRIGAGLDGSGKGMVYARPYRLNRIRLGSEGLPSDVQLKATEQQATPTAGAVVVLDYETDIGYSILVRARQVNGAALPFSATVMDASRAAVGYVGQGGQALVRVSQTQGILTVQWGVEADQRCTFAYAVDKTRKADANFRLLDEVVCQPGDGAAIE